MTNSNPRCTCPPTKRRIPHNAVCPRADDHRGWSIADRATRPRGTIEITEEMVDACHDEFAYALVPVADIRDGLRAALEEAGFTVMDGVAPC